MQQKLDGQSATSTMEVKFKVQALSSLRKIPKISEKKIHLNSLRFFNRLIILSQRDMTVETSLEYELTPLPLSLFSNKDQKMNKANKASFSSTSLKVLTDPLDLTYKPCSSLVVDGGWLLYKGTRSHLAEYCQQVPEICSVSWQALSKYHCGLRWLWELTQRS